MSGIGQVESITKILNKEVLYRDIKSPTSVIDKNLAILRYRSIFVSLWEVHGECR